MDKMRWWQGEGFERWKINEAAMELQALDGVTEGLAQQIGRLFEMDTEQGKELTRLQVVLHTLIDQLARAGVLDATDLSMRIEAAIDLIENPEPPPGAESQSGQTAAPVQTVQCAVCHNRVPADQVYFTEMGQTCPKCYQNIS